MKETPLLTMIKFRFVHEIKIASNIYFFIDACRSVLSWLSFNQLCELFTEVTQASFSCYQSMVIYADGKIAIKNEIVRFGKVICSDILLINFTIPQAPKVVAIMAQARKGTAKIIGSFADGRLSQIQNGNAVQRM